MIYVIDPADTTTTINLVTGEEITRLRWFTRQEEGLPLVTDRVGRRHALRRITLRRDLPGWTSSATYRVTLGGVPVSKRNAKLLTVDFLVPSYLDVADPVSVLLEATAPRDGVSVLEGIEFNGQWINHGWFVEHAAELRGTELAQSA